MAKNLSSMIRNVFSPEYSLNTSIRDRTKVSRPYPYLFFSDWDTAYGSHPGYATIRNILDQVFVRHWGCSATIAFSENCEADKHRLSRDLLARFDVPLTAADREIIARPDLLTWKYTADDVKKGVVSQFIYDYFHTTLSDPRYQQFFEWCLK